MTWVIVMRPSKGITYQVYEGRPPPPKSGTRWRRKLKKASVAIFTNFVWWYITK